MAEQGKFKRALTLTDLIFIGFGAMIGLGWLFAASHVTALAGPAGWMSWVIGGIAVLLLGLIYSELGASIPRAGGIVRYPLYSHGPLIGCLMGFITLIAFSSMIAIEVEAARQYAAYWWPALTRQGSDLPTTLGWLVQFGLLLGFFLLNYWSIKTFSKSNILITLFKYVVPTLIIVVLFTKLKPHNFTVEGFAPFGFSGIEAAVAGGGVMFAYLGLQPIVSVASETKKPQRTIPIALIVSVLFSMLVYVLLQVVFIGGIPTDMLSGGWSGVDQQFSLPFKDIAVALGLGWLAIFVVLDAIISPTGAGNIYMSSTARFVYGWARSGTLMKVFTKVDKKSGIPRPALWLTFLMCIFWTLPFPSWSALVSVVSGALILSYAIAPISAEALRRNAPNLARPFRVRAMVVIGPLAFIIASFIVYWSGWWTVLLLLGSQLAMFVVYLFCKAKVPTAQVSFHQQVKSSWWLVFYYAVMIIISYLGSFGGQGILNNPWDLLAVVVISLVAYYWGSHTPLPKAIIDEDEIEGSETDNPANLSADPAVKS